MLVRTLLVWLAMVWLAGGLRAEEPGTVAGCACCPTADVRGPRSWSRSRREGRARRLMAMRRLWAMCVLLVALGAPVEGATLEFRPTLSGGYSNIVDAHGSFSAAVRVQLWRFLFVQPEYLVLPAGDHADHGPTLLLGLSGGNRDALRPFVGLGGGPVDGYQGDDGIFYFALGVSYPVARQKGIFVQGEFRYGLLGESAYSQVSVGIGISK
jgi:hypothetical protein